MNHTKICKVKVGQEVEGIYYLSKASVKLARNNKEYTDLYVRDNSGESMVRYWGVLPLDFPVPGFMGMIASVEEYQGIPQIVCKNILPSDKPDDLSNFIAISDTFNFDKEYLEQFISSIAASENANIKHCYALLKEVFTNKFMNEFMQVPLFVSGPLSCTSGLLKQTVSCMKSLVAMVDNNNISQEDAAIYLTGMILRNAGYADCYKLDGVIVVETDNSKLVGRASLATSRVIFNIKKMTSKNIEANETVNNKILHIVNAKEDDCKTVGAVLVCAIEKMSFAINSIRSAIEKNSENARETNFISAHHSSGKEIYEPLGSQIPL